MVLRHGWGTQFGVVRGKATAKAKTEAGPSLRLNNAYGQDDGGFVGVREKGKSKNNRRSLGFARDDMVVGIGVS